ncbi:MAG: hypothetical protein RR555_06870 [Bacteroidales bacterium]
MKKVAVLLVCFTLLCCSKTEVVINGEGQSAYRRMNLVVKNTDLAVLNAGNSISNLQILLFDINDKCLNVIPITSVNFDEDNIYATTLTVPNTTNSVTVLANAVGYTYPTQQDFVGMTLPDIFLSTTHTALVPPHYYMQPNLFYEGSAPVGPLVAGEDLQLTVSISGVISKIVIQLADNLDFNSNNGKGFNSVNSASKIYINGIDSVFVVDTPAGVNLSLSEYLSDAIGFEYCQIYKATSFTLGSNGLYSNDVIVFPQINAPALPYLIFSVTGWKGTTPIGNGNPLYYGMRIKNLQLVTGLSSSITSLPRNVVVTVTVNSFMGVGSPVHPNPDFQDMLDLTVNVKSWNDYYLTSGDAN